jgi:hypothetical protein
LLNELASFQDHDDPFIADTAAIVDNIIYDFEQGELTAAQMDELLNDALDSTKVFNLTQNSVRRTEIIQTLQTIKGIVSDLMMFV